MKISKEKNQKQTFSSGQKWRFQEKCKLQISSLLDSSKAKLGRRRKNAQRSQDNVEQFVWKAKIEQWAVFFLVVWHGNASRCILEALHFLGRSRNNSRLLALRCLQANRLDGAMCAWNSRLHFAFFGYGLVIVGVCCDFFVLFFGFWGCRPWLFNTPPAKMKDSELKISSLLVALPGNDWFARLQKHKWQHQIFFYLLRCGQGT